MKRREFFKFIGLAPLGMVAVPEAKPDPEICQHNYVATWGDKVWLEYNHHTYSTQVSWPAPVCSKCGHKLGIG